VGSTSRRRRGPRSIGPGSSFAGEPDRRPSRPDRRPFAARGFSELRAGFVLGDESSRRRRSQAPRGSGRAAPEHDAGSPALGTRPQPLGVLRSTNCARISEEPDAGAHRARDRGSCARPACCAQPPPGRAYTARVARNEPTPRRRPSSGSRRLPDRHPRGRHASQRDLRGCVGFGPEAWSAAPAPRRPRGETRRWASTRTRPWSAR